MIAYLFEVLVIDRGDDEVDGDITDAIGECCGSPSVLAKRGFDIGEWSDDHPLNLRETDDKAWLLEHGKPATEEEIQTAARARAAALRKRQAAWAQEREREQLARLKAKYPEETST
jgi:hypothetical protein